MNMPTIKSKTRRITRAMCATLVLLSFIPTSPAQQAVVNNEIRRLGVDPSHMTANGMVIMGDQLFDSVSLKKSTEGRIDSKAASGFFVFNAIPWPNGNVYLNFDDNFTLDEVHGVLNGCKLWSLVANVSCLPYYNGAEHYAQVHNTLGSLGAYWSYVGAGGRREISTSAAVAAHEFGHLLGMVHEHQRQDRDNYINVHYENIALEWHFAYSPLQSEIQTLSYDFFSLMHYSAGGPPPHMTRRDDGSTNLGGGAVPTVLDAEGMRAIYGPGPGVTVNATQWLGVGTASGNGLPIGNVDGISNNRIWGWAVDPDQAGTSIGVRAFGFRNGSNAIIPLEVLADIPRSDVNAMGYPGNHGFEITLPTEFDGAVYEIYLAGVDVSMPPGSSILSGLSNLKVLPNSPVYNTPIPNNYPAKGRLDGIVSTKVTGWAVDPDRPERSINVRIGIRNPEGQTSYHDVRADQPKPDANAMGYPGDHGFTTYVPQGSSWDGRPHVLSAEALDITLDFRYPLQNSPLQFVIHNVTGGIDSIKGGHIIGWVVDPDDPSRSGSASFNAVVDGRQVFLGASPANLPRADVNLLGYPGNHGFRVRIPSSYYTGNSYGLYSFGINPIGDKISRIPNAPAQFKVLPLKPVAGDLRQAGSLKSVGFYDPANAMFFLRFFNVTGESQLSFQYGTRENNWIPVMGDWDGNGRDGIGLYDPATARFYLRSSTTEGIADLPVFQYGNAGAGWIPVVGDWNGDGIDTIGLYDPVSAQFHLRNSNTQGVADILPFQYGVRGAGWLPIVGDWNGDGKDTVGLYNPATSSFYLRNFNTQGIADIPHFVYGNAGAGWIPIAGDWNGDGITTIGLYDPTTAQFHLRNSNTTGQADVVVEVYPTYLRRQE